MRIIGGTLKGRKLKAPHGRITRPMTDRAREGLFNIISHHDWGNTVGNPLEGANVLDAFCGTGALAFEAISRGATRATLFDKDRNALRIAQENAAALGIKDVCSIMQVDATIPPKADRACQLIFLAPPYYKNLVIPALKALEKTGWTSSESLIVIEMAKDEKLELPAWCNVLEKRRYGDTALEFVAIKT